MVAVDSEMRPSSIPQFSPTTEEEKELWEMANNARDAMG